MSIFSKELEDFLQGRGLLEQAKMLAQENGTTYTDDLWSAFEWVKSPQGYSFWRDLQAEFDRIRKDPPQQTRRSNKNKGTKYILMIKDSFGTEVYVFKSEHTIMELDTHKDQVLKQLGLEFDENKEWYSIEALNEIKKEVRLTIGDPKDA